MKKFAVILVCICLTSTVLADQPKVGAVGAQFLKIGVGSKYQGMGETSVATVNDIYATYWNPAGLVGVENWSVGFTSVNWLLDINLNYVAFAKSFEDVGVLGVSVTVLSGDEQEITTTLNNDTQDGTGQYYNFSSYAIGLSFARQLTTRFSFGATGKFLGETIGDVNAKGVAFDFGTLLYTGFRSLRMGMSITNMGSQMQFKGRAMQVPYNDDGIGNSVPVEAELKANPYNIPLTFRVGMAFDVEMGPRSMVTFSGEFKHPNDADKRGSMGAEYAFNEQFYLRSGYKFGYDEETVAFGGGLSTPIGSGTSLVIDYAWQDFGRLESAQRFSLGFTF